MTCISLKTSHSPSVPKASNWMRLRSEFTLDNAWGVLFCILTRDTVCSCLRREEAIIKGLQSRGTGITLLFLLHDKLLKDLNLYHSPTSGPILPLAFPYSYCTHKGSRKASRSSWWVSHVAEWQVILYLLLHESLGLKSIWFWVWWSKDGDLFLPSGNFCGVMRVFPNLGFSYHYRTLMCEGEGRLLAELWTLDYSVSMACVCMLVSYISLSLAVYGSPWKHKVAQISRPGGKTTQVRIIMRTFQFDLPPNCHNI